tara:strand:+ start:693 stop:1922 length:1230 start_codon:yes stop_codon:yes gene_type:complete
MAGIETIAQPPNYSGNPGFAYTEYGRKGGPSSAVGLIGARINTVDQTFEPNTNRAYEVNVERYNTFKAPSSSIDGEILDLQDDIKDEKTWITQNATVDNIWYESPATFSSIDDAKNAISPIYDGGAISNGVETKGMAFARLAIEFVGDETFTAGSFLSHGTPAPSPTTIAYGQIAFSSTGKYVMLDLNTVFGTFPTGSTEFQVGLTTTYDSSTVVSASSSVAYVGFTTLLEDLSIITKLPALEPIPDGSKSNIFGDVEYNALNSSNKGEGVPGLSIVATANTFFPNANNYLQNGDGYEGWGSGDVWSRPPATEIGEVVAFSTTGTSKAVSIAGSITSRITVINHKRFGDASNNGITTFTDTSNVVKKMKKESAVNAWSYKRTDVDMTNFKADLINAYEVLNDPQYGGPW